MPMVSQTLETPPQSSHKLSRSISSAQSFESKTTGASTAFTSNTALSDQNIEDSGKPEPVAPSQTQQEPHGFGPIEDLRKLSKHDLGVLAGRQGRGADVIKELEWRFEEYRVEFPGFEVVLNGEEPDFYYEKCRHGERAEEWEVISSEIFLYYTLTRGIEKACEWRWEGLSVLRISSTWSLRATLLTENIPRMPAYLCFTVS